MSDMPERIFVDPSRKGTDWWIRKCDQDAVALGYEWTDEYIRADKYADLERQRDELVEFMQSLMADSEGVAGWHRNGTVASWEEVGADEALAKVEKDDE